MAYKPDKKAPFPCSFEAIGILALLSQVACDADVDMARVTLTSLLVVRPREESIDTDAWPHRFARRRLDGTLTELDGLIADAVASGTSASVVAFMIEIRDHVRAAYDVIAHSIPQQAPPPQVLPPAPSPPLWMQNVLALRAARAARDATQEKALNAHLVSMIEIDASDI